MRRFLAAAVAATALASPASAAPSAPVEGNCTFVIGPSTSPNPRPVLTAYATTLGAAGQVGVSCWIADGGFGSVTAANPGYAAATTGTGWLYSYDFTYCYEVWAEFLDGTSYASAPVCR